MASTSRSRVGTTVAGKYRILSLLGEGGMGAVYEAEHLVTHRRVAVKLLHASLGWSDTFVERFLLEAQLATKVGHPNIIEVLDAGVDEDGACYAVLTLLKGESVATMLDREKKLSVTDALSITIEVLDALSAAHAAGVIHRDIKPDNVFIANGPRGERQVKLLDFGISKVIADHDAEAPRRGLTATGAIMGTAEYMSPEQVLGDRSIDGRTDLWSVGVMLCEMLTGAVPFTGRTAHLVLVAITDDPLPSLAALAPELSPGVVHIVERALEKDVAKRYPTADEMIADLRAELDVAGTTNSLAHSRRGLPAATPSSTSTVASPPGRPANEATAPTMISERQDVPPRRSTANPGTLAGQVKRTNDGLVLGTDPATARRPVKLGVALLVGLLAIGTAVVAIRSNRHPAITNAATSNPPDTTVATPTPVTALGHQTITPVTPPTVPPIVPPIVPTVPVVPAHAIAAPEQTPAPEPHRSAHAHHANVAHATVASPAGNTTSAPPHAEPATTHSHHIAPMHGIDE